MLKTEAQWLGMRLTNWPADRGVVLNVGSSNGHFRTQVQPWIEQYVLAPARVHGLTMVHQDLFPGEGVDVAGDLLSEQCQAELRQFHAYGLVCSNVLEHVINRSAFTEALCRLLPPSGRALVTVPYQFPYHADPIDTGYRPNVPELLSLFPTFKVVRAEILCCGHLLDLIRDNPARLLLAGLQKSQTSRAKKRLRDWLPYAVRTFKMTCVELECPEST